MPFFGNLGSAALEASAAIRSAAGDASGPSSMHALPMQMQNLSTWQHMNGGISQAAASAAPFIEGMLKNWSQSLMAAAARAPCRMSAQATSAAAARAVYQPPRKLKKSATAEKKVTKQRKLGGEGEPGAAAAGAAACKVKVESDADGSALDVLSAAVDSQQGDRDDASLNAATALHAMHGCWQSQDDALLPGVFALQQLSPRVSKKRNRSLLKDLAVNTADALDEDCMPLTPCSKGRTSKQLDSAYNHTTNPEHVCRTKDGSPVVDVHVPAVCECGSVVVGVWYRNRAHYCRWFRHERYAALRALLEQNRRKNKSRPLDERGPADTPGSTANDISESAEPPPNDCASEPAPASSNVECESSAGGEPGASTWGSKTSVEELLAPKFLSLLCLFQFVKHDDAVELVYPRGILGNTMMKPHTLKISANRPVMCALLLSHCSQAPTSTVSEAKDLFNTGGTQPSLHL